MSDASAIPNYEPQAAERFGRRIKLEYVGMVSVYVIIGLFVFRGLPTLLQAFWAALGAQNLFLGLKKKTRDHISGSLVLLAAAWLARPAVVGLEWAVPFLLFATCVYAMEGYVEKRQTRIFLLPLIFFLWGWLDLTWMPALLFVGAYLSLPLLDKPGLRRRLSWLFLSSVATPWIGFWRSANGRGDLQSMRTPLGPEHLLSLALFGVPVLVCLFLYWRRLILPHRVNGLLFALLAPWDVRLTAAFAMAGAVLFTATVFRLSIDSDRLRPFFKHAEWHYFWVVFAFALWVVFSR